MAISPEQLGDLQQYQLLSTHITTILDKESTIPSETRQLTEANITKLNDVYGKTMDAIELILDTQLTPP